MPEPHPSPTKPVQARILVVTDVEWASMTDATFASQDDPTRPLAFLEIAKRHDLPRIFLEAFGVDFFRYRGELRRIAQASLERIPGARLSIGFEDFDRWFYDDDDEFIFPIDDDDLYHPRLVETLQ